MPKINECCKKNIQAIFDEIENWSDTMQDIVIKREMQERSYQKIKKKFGAK